MTPWTHTWFLIEDFLATIAAWKSPKDALMSVLVGEPEVIQQNHPDQLAADQLGSRHQQHS